MLKRTINDVEFTAEEIGDAVANASDSQQREFFCAMANACDSMDRNGGSWVMQCRAIVDGLSGKGLTQSERSRIASILNCLIDHLNEQE